MDRFRWVAYGNLVLAAVGLALFSMPWSKWLILASALVSMVLALWILQRH